MSDDTKPKYHCPMDRIAQENIAGIDEGEVANAIRELFKWQEAAFERSRGSISGRVKAKMIMHMVEHLHSHLNHQLANGMRLLDEELGFTEADWNTAILSEQMEDLMRDLSGMFSTRGSNPVDLEA